jgi:hypothetical protein
MPLVLQVALHSPCSHRLPRPIGRKRAVSVTKVEVA